jgi:DNA segregation ATPase FtsK/SpoIIIE-like protein
MDMLEEEGIVGSAEGTGSREVLMGGTEPFEAGRET